MEWAGLIGMVRAGGGRRGKDGIVEATSGRKAEDGDDNGGVKSTGGQSWVNVVAWIK